MTGGDGSASRRARIRTEQADARTVASAVRPDNTAEMTTRVEDGAVITTVTRETTGGLRSTVDDYVVNLDVAARTIEHAIQQDTRQSNGHDRP